MSWRLHRRGRFRAWLGARFGGDAELGDRIWRRALHFFGVAVLLYYVLPTGFFVVLPNEIVLLLALAAVLAMEGLRLAKRLELPTIRPLEQRRVASYALYGIALTAAVLIFPEAVAVAVVLGVAVVDPLAGELRLRPGVRPATLWVAPTLTYALLAAPALVLVGRWSIGPAVAVGLLLGVVATAVERPKLAWYDDDLGMTLIPGAVLTLALWAWPGIPGLG